MRRTILWHAVTGLVLSGLVTLSSGCRKELCYNHDEHAYSVKVDVTATWEREWERDHGRGWKNTWEGRGWNNWMTYDDLRPEVPGGIRAVVYDPDGNKIAVNHKLTPEELAAQTVTIENVPVGKVTFCVLANEAALGKDYDTEEFELVDVPGRTSKKALLEDPDRTYFPKWFSEVNIDKGLPMSWIVRDYEVKSGSPTGTPGEPLEAQLVRCVAKLNISMNNDLDSEINIKAVNFGTFFGDRLYLFGEQSLDVPGSTAYEAKSYPYETEADYIKIPAYGEKMLVCYIYPSYAWLPEMTDSPYTIGFATLAKGTYPQKAFIAEGALKSIARNTQVNIRATLSVDARLILKYEVVDWGKKEITVPPFN